MGALEEMVKRRYEGNGSGPIVPLELQRGLAFGGCVWPVTCV